ncbi:hypothetical protein GCM10010182_44800 [Actinomadura cremea]|nr:hypothetical protein GCM10010182_44800 [Actinomadura cremea]
MIRTTSRTVSPGGASKAKKGRAAGASLRLAGPTDQDPFPVAGPGAAAGPAGGDAVAAGAVAAVAGGGTPGAAAAPTATAAAAIRCRSLIDHLGRRSGRAGQDSVRVRTAV